MMDPFKTFDTEVVEDFDDFFVGGGSKAMMKKCADTKLSFSGLVSDKPAIGSRLDLDRFVQEKLEVSDDLAQDLFLLGKAAAYELFDLSADLRAEDEYILKGMLTATHDYYAVYNTAFLTALLELSIPFVKFRNKDNCVICRACDGLVLEAENIKNLLIQGISITHPYCSNIFSPVLDRRFKYEFEVNCPKLQVDEVQVFNMPMELREPLKELILGVKHQAVEFRDLEEYLRKPAVCVHEEDGVLLVHNNYLYGYGPDDFLRAFLNLEGVKQ